MFVIQHVLMTCPYACYPYVDLDYYIPPPPPPPSLPPQLSSKHHQNTSPYVIISVALFAKCVPSCQLLFDHCQELLQLDRRRTPPTQAGSDEEFFDENRAPIVDHPIWYINTVGLQPSLIDKISIFKYKAGDDMVEGTNCSVCLNEFQDNESLRLLPNCKHAFHIHCIDTWLRSHTNCPLCRSGIVSNSLNAPALVPIELTLGANLSPNEERTLENDEQREVNSNNEVMDGEIGVNQEEFLQTERCCGDGQVQSMRRSVSVDFSISSSRGLDNMFVLSRMSGGEEAVGENSRSILYKEEPVLMKRSFSYGSRPFFSRHNRSSRPFFSRHNRSRSSVLPL